MSEFQIGDRVGVSIGWDLFNCAIVYRREYEILQRYVDVHHTYCRKPWITGIARVDETRLWSQIPYEKRAYIVFRPIDPGWMNTSYSAGQIVQLGGWRFEVLDMLLNYPHVPIDERERIKVRFLHNNQISNIVVRFR